MKERDYCIATALADVRTMESILQRGPHIGVQDVMTAKEVKAMKETLARWRSKLFALANENAEDSQRR